MDDDKDLLNLEGELKRLRPRTPSEVMLARIERDIVRAGEAPGRSHGPTRRWVSISIVAAAALMLAWLGLRAPERSADKGSSSTLNVIAAQPKLKPVKAENFLYNTTDDGVYTLSDGTRAHRVRKDYVDTITWQDPRTHSSLQMTIPREEIRYVPVSAY
ncbi:MAG TPA: hypothetical protein VKC60_05180 [Opitutaceae bacterium]|nr:hypothetical protein [Opitutaceae bacterium]